MVETYEYKSKIATAIAFIAAFIAYIGEPGLKQILPAEYAYLIPIIIFIAGYILAQLTENKRVEVAEQMVHELYTETPTAPDENGDDDGC